MNIRSVKLKKGMNREDVNNLIHRWCLLNDEFYNGINHKHDWVCIICGNIMHDKTWDNIRVAKNIKCNN